MQKLLSILILLLLSLPATAAKTSQCIQSPKRVSACPNLLYRSAQLPAMEKPQLLCICATDFSELLQPATTDTELIRQRMTKRQLEAELGMPVEPILDILRRKQ
ncbi:hypothetical protein QE250_15045 [Chromatiaceae bacterium AAb-1]|nr:hypothetical protein [Chromatiaceae bacterium AAb-1]